MVRISGLVGEYKFDSFEDAIHRVSSWLKDDLITEEESMKFIYELFHQIPEGVYNEIVDRL